MEKQIKVSVIMGVYNQRNREILEKAVKSILNQTLRELEFIIYDDGSHPEVGEMIRNLEKMDNRIIVIGSEENKGLAFSLNTCIENARGKYIARMDADDISLPNRLQVQYDFLEQHPDYAWCGCNAKVIDDEGCWGMRQMPEIPTEADFLRFSPYIHPTVMYRAEIFEQQDKYQVSPDTLRCEDYEIFMRYHEAGYRGYNIQQYLFQYREDKISYQKRTISSRLKEAKVRYRNFATMGILFPKGWLYVMRPIAGCFVPNRIIAWSKKKEIGQRNETETRTLQADLTQ